MDNFEVRLSNGNVPSQGRVEVLYNGHWGTVCRYEWDEKDAEVVCRQLGYSGGVAVTTKDRFGYGCGHIWLHNVDCQGNELTLAACQHPPLGVNDCSHKHDAGVVCNAGVDTTTPSAAETDSSSSSSSQSEGDEGCAAHWDVYDTGEIIATSVPGVLVALFGDKWGEGRVMVRQFGGLGAVCDELWDDADAQVVCRQLGLSGGKAIRGYGGGTGTIWMSSVQCNGSESRIQDCSHVDWQSHNCVHSQDAGVICDSGVVTSAPGVPVRLMMGAAWGEGRVMLKEWGGWATVCDDDLWDDTDAKVVCRQLGLTGGKAIHGFGGSAGYAKMASVQCSGNERCIKDCSHEDWRSHCINSLDAGVICETADAEGNIRLVGGCNEYEGRVELYHDNRWGTVSREGKWDHNEAAVVCSQLGYRGGMPREEMFGWGSGPIWMKHLSCRGNESRLVDCEFDGMETDEEHRDYYAGVSCEPCVHPEGSVRLVGGNGAHEGRVEIYHDNQWGTVCDDNWDHADAAVVCREMGFSGGLPLQFAHFGEGYGKIWMDETRCSLESRLVDCVFDGWGNVNCDHSEDAGVICDTSSAGGGDGSEAERIASCDGGSPASEGSIRLVEGNVAYEGLVEVYHGNRWGTVCDDKWGREDAEVVCRQLGFVGGTAVREFGGGSGIIWMDDVKCSGSESRLADCDFRGWASTNCHHHEDAGVICDPVTASEGSIRLVGGRGAHEGRLEVYHENRWGVVCDDHWGREDAAVVCRQLGFSGGTPLESFTEDISIFYWMDDVGCSGSESRLVDCDFPGWGDDNCDDTEKAGVLCEDNSGSHGDGDGGNPAPYSDTIRLVGGVTGVGRVEIYHLGAWGTICGDGLGNYEAIVACQQLGLIGGIRVRDDFGSADGRIWLSEVICRGYEERLENCRHTQWGLHNCYRRYDDFAIACIVPATNERTTDNGKVRIVNNGAPWNSGRVEIYHDGQWGTVCDNHFDKADADVVCRMLGYDIGFERKIQRWNRKGSAQPGSGTIWLDDVRCQGHESDLEDCDHSPWGQHNCNHNNDVGVQCY